MGFIESTSIRYNNALDKLVIYALLQSVQLIKQQLQHFTANSTDMTEIYGTLSGKFRQVARGLATFRNIQRWLVSK